MQAEKSAAESKATEMAEQLQELQAQKAAAYSRNLALEKLLELQGSQANDRAASSDASSSTLVSDTQSAPASSQTQLASHNICNPIQLAVDVDALARRCVHSGQAPVVRFTTAQLHQLEFADFAKLWKGYISRCTSCEIGPHAAQHCMAMLH